MNEKLSIAVAAAILAVMVLTGALTADQALDFCRSLVEILVAISRIVDTP